MLRPFEIFWSLGLSVQWPCNVLLCYSKDATGGKTIKTKVLPRFCKTEKGGGSGSGSAPLMWPPLWQSCLPKICRGGPDYI